MTERPKAVTVIGWFWVVGGALGMVLALPYALWGRELIREYSVDAVLAMSSAAFFLWVFLSSLVCFLCGIGILKGRSWGRILALAYCIVATLIVVVLYLGHPLFWLNLIGDVVFTAIMGYFLYRPEASAFFS
jgi:hypothetical protein